jgi:hypothetical protein
MAAPPAPNRTPSCRPAVPPPPVSGAVVGYGRADGMMVCELAGWVAAVWVGCAADDVWEPDDACDDDGPPDADADAEVEADDEARAEVFVPLDDAAVDRVVALLDDPWPVGDGVRVPVWIADELGVCVAGVTMVGVADPVPPMHPDTVTANSTAPAAERPANSHRVCASGMVRRIFMNPPPI